MASNYTENYGLCQWEATDQVLRTEFNKDNAKVDEALKGTADVAQAAQVLAQAAYSPENSPFVVGSYTGNGTAKRKIELGFTPKAVLVFGYQGQTYTDSGHLFGGLAVTGCNAAGTQEGTTSWKGQNTIAAVAENGFYVGLNSESGIKVWSNYSGFTYMYIAFR